MPANLPPEYLEAEKRYKEARSTAEKVVALEDLLSKLPKHKGTDKLRADLRSRLSKLRDEALRKKKSGGRTDLYTVDREGAAQVVLVGFANSGKSSLLKSLTNANPVIADYPMSTIMPLSGMMPFEDIPYQLVDLPPVGNESTDGWVSGIIRNSDILLLVIDLADDPDVQAELLMEQLKSWRISLLKAGSFIMGHDLKNPASPKRVVIAGNKADHGVAAEGLRRLKDVVGNAYPVISVSAKTKTGLEDLKVTIFEVSRIIRVYSKEPGKEPDLGRPFTLPAGSTVLDLAELIHRSFVQTLRYVCVWGSTRFPGQRVQKDYILKDRDIVEIRV